jgi:hypothetical protein
LKSTLFMDGLAVIRFSTMLPHMLSLPLARHNRT